MLSYGYPMGMLWLSYGKDCCFDTKWNYLVRLVSARKMERLCSFAGIQTFLLKVGAKLRKINEKSKNVALFCPNICIFDFFAVPLHAFSCKKHVIHLLTRAWIRVIRSP